MSEIDFELRARLKKLPPDEAIRLYLETLPPERRALVEAGWSMMRDVTAGVMRRAYSFDKERLLVLVDVLTDDLPELLQLAPEDQMPLELKEMFRGWISGFEHMLPGQRVRSENRKHQMMIETLLGGWYKASMWMVQGIEWLRINELPLPTTPTE